MLNPITQSKQYLLAYFLFWALIAWLQSVVAHWILEEPWMQTIVESVVYVSSFGLIGLGVWFVVRFSGIEGESIINPLATHAASASLLVFVWMSIAHGANAMIFGDSIFFMDLPEAELWWRVSFGYIFYIFVALNYYLLIFYQNFKEKQFRESEMKTMLKESELSMLKAQINPHFIFNSLNSISSLTLTKPESAHEMIVKLSSFLRHTIGYSETDLVPIKKEIETIQLYLDIEKSRFGDKLSVNINGLSELAEEVNIPNLILQPLIENAVKYGVYESTENTSIDIDLQLEEGVLDVRIVNGLEADGVARQGKGIGLKNVQSRLQLVYERNDLLQVKKTLGKFEVKVSIPQIKSND